MKNLVLFLSFSIISFGSFGQPDRLKPFDEYIKNVEIVRDLYGIPHIYGTTDADVVFGLMYAQAEDDFQRIEMNYIEKLGRLAEVNGEKDIYNDLQIQILIDTAEAIKEYNASEPWLKKLLDAYAAGLNYFLLKHPKVKPLLITKFEPWYPLLWTDGSIGAINTAGGTVNELKNFYEKTNLQTSVQTTSFSDHQSGSNGFAISPSKSETGAAMLYINPHVTFYFRPEVHLISKEGLNAYGAVTWGQFFVYQGFNEYNGWMHTSSAVDVADLYEETITKKDNKYYSTFNGEFEPLVEKNYNIQYKTGNTYKTKAIKVFFSRNGPIIAERQGKWISLRSNNRSINGLIQSWKRTKTTTLDEFKEVMNIRANTSNNTVYADRDGNIAYWHGNFVPKRDSNYNWSKPVDGSISETQWKGLHAVEEIVHIINPSSGWIQNCNSTPFTSSGLSSPLKMQYPTYMAPDGENFRGLNAIRLLSSSDKLNLEELIKIGYEPTLEAFKILIPPLIQHYKSYNAKNERLDSVINILEKWDYKSDNNSVATSVSVEWAQRLNNSIQRIYIGDGDADQVLSAVNFTKTAEALQFIKPLEQALQEMDRKYGSWNVAWGEINRFQRISSSISAKHDDNLPSFAVSNASALWGQLASFNSRVYPNTKKRYGYSGNSFVAAVEFGSKIKAKSLLAGGNSGLKDSKHFNDQGEMFANGKFKDVLFYEEDVRANALKTYKP